MCRRAGVALALALMVAPAPVRAQGVDADLQAARRAFEDGQFERSVSLLTSVIQSGEARGEALGQAYWNRAITHVALGDKAKAFPDFEMFTALTPADADGPAMLVELGVELRRYPDAAAALATLFDLAPGRVRDRRGDVVEIVRAQQLKGEWAQADALLRRYAIVDDEDPAINVARARTAAALGRRQEALDLIRRSASQHNLALVRADKAFAPLWDDPAFAAATDITALFERDLEQAEAGVRAEPDRLFRIVLRMSALWRLGRFDEAIRLGEQSLASDVSRFVDHDYREAQMHEQLARSLAMKGDLPAAERAFRTGIERLADKSETVVTLMMSAGQFLAATAGKYREALDLADRASRLAQLIYGTGIGDSVRALAYWGLRQDANLNRIVVQAEKNMSGSQSIAIDLYLLLGRTDDAASLVAKQLADPARADTMLVGLQRYTRNRPAAGAVEKVIEKGWDALRAHPAVIAALSAAGRITDVAAANRF